MGIFFSNTKRIKPLDDGSLSYVPPNAPINMRIVKLKNVEGICYLNTAVQMLFNILLVRAFFLDESIKEENFKKYQGRRVFTKMLKSRNYDLGGYNLYILSSLFTQNVIRLGSGGYVSPVILSILSVLTPFNLMHVNIFPNKRISIKDRDFKHPEFILVEQEFMSFYAEDNQDKHIHDRITLSLLCGNRYYDLVSTSYYCKYGPSDYHVIACIKKEDVWYHINDDKVDLLEKGLDENFKKIPITIEISTLERYRRLVGSALYMIC